MNYINEYNVNLKNLNSANEFESLDTEFHKFEEDTRWAIRSKIPISMKHEPKRVIKAWYIY